MQGNYTRYLMNLQRANIERARSAPLQPSDDNYPHVTFGQQVGRELLWGVQNAQTGETTGPRYLSAEIAEAKAADLKAGRISYPG